MRRARFFLLAAALAASACASRGGSPNNALHFARGIGSGSASDVITRAHRVLALHQFEIYQEEAPPSIYIETRWRTRQPFEDEAMLGIDAAQTRAIVRARPRNATSAMGEAYTVDLTVENRVRVKGTEDWVHTTVTPQAEAFGKRIAEDLRTELNIGVRRH
jgi:hypothetical protein